MLGAPVAERHLDLWLVAEAVAGFECSGDQLHVVGAARVGVRDASDVVGGDVEDCRGGGGAIMESALSDSAASSMWAAKWMLVTGRSIGPACWWGSGGGPKRAVRTPSGQWDVHGRVPE